MIATKIGRSMMLDSYTSTMCLESWGRNSYARALSEISLEQNLKDKLVIAIPLLDGSGYTKETINVEYEWKPLRCDTCKLFGHSCDQCPKCVGAAKTCVNDDHSDGLNA